MTEMENHCSIRSCGRDTGYLHTWMCMLLLMAKHKTSRAEEGTKVDLYVAVFV